MQYPVLGYISIVCQFILVLIGLISYSKIPKELKLFLLLVILSVSLDTLSIYQYFTSYSSPLIYQIFIPIELITIMYIISKWQLNIISSKIFVYLALFYLVFWFILKIFIEPFNSFSYLSSTISASIIILSSGYTLFIVLFNTKGKLITNSRFWFLVSFIIYYSGILFPLSLQSFFESFPKADFFKLWSLSWILNLLSSILFSVGFLCQRKQT